MHDRTPFLTALESPDPTSIFRSPFGLRAQVPSSPVSGNSLVGPIPPPLLHMRGFVPSRWSAVLYARPRQLWESDMYHKKPSRWYGRMSKMK